MIWKLLGWLLGLVVPDLKEGQVMETLGCPEHPPYCLIERDYVTKKIYKHIPNAWGTRGVDNRLTEK